MTARIATPFQPTVAQNPVSPFRGQPGEQPNAFYQSQSMAGQSLRFGRRGDVFQSFSRVSSPPPNTSAPEDNPGFFGGIINGLKGLASKTLRWVVGFPLELILSALLIPLKILPFVGQQIKNVGEQISATPDGKVNGILQKFTPILYKTLTGEQAES